MRLTLSKSEKLKHRRILDDVVRTGHSTYVRPLRLIWKETELPENIPCQIAFSVPKRRFKKAVDRNRIKRLMRESWRLHKVEITAMLGDRHFAAILVFTENTLPTQAQIHQQLNALLQKWATIIQHE